MDKPGKFIVLDGMDGSGKGTQLALLRSALKDLPIHYTREPGGTPLGEEIREMLLRPAGVGPSRHPYADFFLFWASRGSHVEEVVEPTRAGGVHVVTDRYDSSTFAFQIYGEQHNELERLFCEVRTWLPMRYRPDLYLFLDLPAEVAYERRAKDAGQAKTRFDLQPLEYHERVRQGFRDFAKLIKGGAGQVHIVDANRPPEAVHETIVSHIRGICS